MMNSLVAGGGSSLPRGKRCTSPERLDEAHELARIGTLSSVKESP